MFSEEFSDLIDQAPQYLVSSNARISIMPYVSVSPNFHDTVKQWAAHKKGKASPTAEIPAESLLRPAIKKCFRE
jgi:hypothetical protein